MTAGSGPSKQLSDDKSCEKIYFSFFLLPFLAVVISSNLALCDRSLVFGIPIAECIENDMRSEYQRVSQNRCKSLDTSEDMVEGLTSIDESDLQSKKSVESSAEISCKSSFNFFFLGQRSCQRQNHLKVSLHYCRYVISE